MAKARTDLFGILLSSLGAILERDLRALRREVETYSDERDLWREVPGVANVAGTLVLHLTGNVQHYFGARLGGTSYIRDRPAEFARRNVPRVELLREVGAAEAAVKAALSQLGESQLTTDFPETISGSRIVTADYLVHLSAHFAYHLGQLDCHRRIVTGQNKGVDAMSPRELSSAHPPDAR
jgi:uncharacterized damage-inducible protein DinB